MIPVQDGEREADAVADLLEAGRPLAGDEVTDRAREFLGVETRKPLNVEGVLWVAALDRVPIEERVEWVAEMTARVLAINAQRREAE